MRETVLSGVAIVGMAVVAVEILRGDMNSIFLSGVGDCSLIDHCKLERLADPGGRTGIKNLTQHNPIILSVT